MRLHRDRSPRKEPQQPEAVSTEVQSGGGVKVLQPVLRTPATLTRRFGSCAAGGTEVKPLSLQRRGPWGKTDTFFVDRQAGGREHEA